MTLPSEPPAVPATPPIRPVRMPGSAQRVVLQIGHRVASVGLFVFLAAGIARYLDRLSGVWQLPAVAFVASDIGLVCGVLGWGLASWRRGPRGEAIGLSLFAGLLSVASGWMMLMLRFGWWQP